MLAASLILSSYYDNSVILLLLQLDMMMTAILFLQPEDVNVIRTVIIRDLLCNLYYKAIYL